MFKNAYVKKAYENIEAKHKDELEYLDVVKEIFSSIELVYEKHPEYEDLKILEKLSEPENIIEFDVEWEDDLGRINTNKGYRVQYSSIVGPYKGGLRFSDKVTFPILKALSFEQTFKNALTGLPMGGGKGGSDFNPIGKSSREVERFCHAFMEKLYPHIGAEHDIPAGDIGVGGKEIGFMYDEYIKYKDDIGALTGKPLDKGGILCRTEATGYGLCYFVEEYLKDNGLSFKDKRVIISGSGNVATYACAKASELGAKVVAMSDIDGYIYDEDGIDYKDLIKVTGQRESIEKYVTLFNKGEYHKNPQGLYDVKCDIALPCATQRELNLIDAKKLVENGCICVGEGANMPCTDDATEYLVNNKILITPSKASNAGGVSCSYFEMCQNKENRKWTFEETDMKLKETMSNIYRNLIRVSKEYGYDGDLLMAANIYGFETIIKNYKEKGM